ncbi:DUF262 domain-containing protein [Cellulomonas sp. IC4_254]|uniref:DUF262 domain-containing protein n=1 Tax=Cellulomonas sp. IC4_254 TaxID=2714040 RepID=UPI00141FF516|nr:DUF262 domain-containing protein [Cellulomonas sp. IC4_254]NHT16764.1 DUF262 domain-containing protein [Cellulomonas sp. IC4_254]
MSLEQTNTVYVALDLLTWQQQGTLVLSPKFQRRGVWSSGARGYFIDTLLRGYPVPPIHLRLSLEPTRGVVREVIDGQQRLKALLDFMAGKFRLPRQLNAPWAGRSYEQLTPEQIQTLMEFRFQVYQYQNLDDRAVLEIFQRINTYSVPLNAQELRHGKYFGEFRQSVYELAFDRIAFWRQGRIFTESAIARMSEAELVSELLILQMDGLQDKKKSINEFYAQLDESWGDHPVRWSTRARESVPAEWLPRAECERRFSVTLDAIIDAVGADISGSEFRRVPMFYSLYAVVYHRLFGLPGFNRDTPRSALDSSAATLLSQAIAELSELVAEKPQVDELSGWRREFLVASSRQTDNVGPRRDRSAVLWDRAGLGG